MRIVGGTARGRKLLGPPKGLQIRPTSDKVREAIFDVLGAAMPGGFGGRVIDLFAGTGALGIEALSRGAVYALFIEKSADAARVTRENLRRVDCAARARVLVDEAGHALPKLRSAGEGPFDAAFLDPPYGSTIAAGAAALLVSEGLLAPEGVVVIEFGAREPLVPPAGLEIFREKRYGDTRVAFLRHAGTPLNTGRNSEFKTALKGTSEAKR